MISRVTLCALSLVGLLALPDAATAQSTDLARIDSLIAAGRLGDAREALVGWRSRNAPGQTNVASRDRAFALLLQGRLATDPDSALIAYRALAIGYPTAPFADQALLRVGQAMLVADSALGAIGFLQRLTDEHPSSPLRATANLWLFRAFAAVGDTAAACRTGARELAVRGGDDPDVHRTLQEEYSTLACGT